MGFVDLLAAICIIVNASKDVSMFQLPRDLDCQYKKAFVFAHKLREAMALKVHKGKDLEGRVEIIMREREGRTLPFLRKSESEGVAPANKNVSRMAMMSADGASHWDELHLGHHVDRVNHSEIYSDVGKHTNLVESHSSRLCKMVKGQNHHVFPHYGCTWAVCSGILLVRLRHTAAEEPTSTDTAVRADD